MMIVGRTNAAATLDQVLINEPYAGAVVKFVPVSERRGFERQQASSPSLLLELKSGGRTGVNDRSSDREQEQLDRHGQVQGFGEVFWLLHVANERRDQGVANEGVL